MSGYSLSFKLISSDLYNKHRNNSQKLRANALCLGIGDKKDFVIEISKFEYIDNKKEYEIDGYKIFVYSPLLVICDKLRAICQKMKEYRNDFNNLDLPRARDFYDIYVVNHNLVGVDFKKPCNRLILQEVFNAKKVNLSLLSKIKDKRTVHEDDFKNVLQTDLNQKAKPAIFDYYFEYVLDLVEDLQEFWIK